MPATNLRKRVYPWRATAKNTNQVYVEFQVATGIADDEEGGVASGATTLSLPVRLRSRPSNRDNTGNDRVQFPGLDEYQFTFFGWVGHENTPNSWYFPSELRRQNRVIGECSLPDPDGDRPGRIEVWVKPMAELSDQIDGERFVAGWTPT